MQAGRVVQDQKYGLGVSHHGGDACIYMQEHFLATLDLLPRAAMGLALVNLQELKVPLDLLPTAVSILEPLVLM